MVVHHVAQEEDRRDGRSLPELSTPNNYGALGESPIHRARPKEWTNGHFPIYVVQALARDQKFLDTPPSDEEKFAAFGRTRCNRSDDCAGTTLAYRSGGQLRREAALHAVHGHYLFPNLSICRFHSGVLGDYAADLIFEIDAHADVPVRVNVDFYMPFIGVAVQIGRRIYDFLVGELSVDPAYITTCVTRMGARVTVDWRAFGPRRFIELLYVNAWIQSRVFGEGEVEGLGTVIQAKTEVDVRLYLRSDRVRQGGNRFTGSNLRPIGSVHSKSSDSRLWSRVTPVPHATFDPANVEWLTNVSRAALRDISNFVEPGLFSMKALVTHPEGRFTQNDHVVEGVAPADKLVVLFDADPQPDDLRPDLRRLVTRAEHHGRPRTSSTTRMEIGEITISTLEMIAGYLGTQWRHDGDKLLINCPRPSCKPRDFKACFFLPNGTFSCFRCCQGSGMSLHDLSRELGFTHLVPKRFQSSSPVQRLALTKVPPPPREEWGLYTEVIEQVCTTLEEARAHQDATIERFLDTPSERMLHLGSGTGIGKTYAVKNVLARRGIRSRIFVSRDDAKLTYAELPGAKVIQGRRLGFNCDNTEADAAAKLGEAVAETVCRRCPSMKSCSYWAQFADVADQQHLLLHHAHGALAHLAMFGNGAAVEVVDEDALAAVVNHVDLDVGALERLLVRRHLRWATAADADDDGGYSITVEQEPECIARFGATKNIDLLIRGLRKQLTQDAAVRAGGDVEEGGRAVDRSLAKMLFDNDDIVKALDAITQDDLDQHEQHRRHLLTLREVARGGDAGRFLRGSVTVLPDGFFSKANDSGDLLAAEIAKLEPLHLDDDGDPPACERPPRCLEALVVALSELLHAHRHRVGVTSALAAIRAGKKGKWRLRLTERRSYLDTAKKIIVMSATMTAERAHLIFGYPSPAAGWVRHVATVPRTHQRTAVLDRSFSRSSLSVEHHRDFFNEVVEVVRAIVSAENERTGLPVGVIGPAAIINNYNAAVVGAEASNYRMPFTSGTRNDKWHELRDLTLRHGYISGYAGAVSGSNDYAVVQDGKTRFIRALVVLGSPFPQAEGFADDHRGLYAHHSPQRLVLHEDLGLIEVTDDTPLDWSFAYRTQSYDGTSDGDTALFARNVPGFRDDRANEVLRGVFDGEIRQIEGRGRWDIPDPVEPALTGRVFLFCPPVRGMEVDEVLYLDDLRKRLGLAIPPRTKLGRPAKGDHGEQLLRRWKKRGRPATLKWLVEGLMADDWPPKEVRRAVLEALELAGIALDDTTEKLLDTAIEHAKTGRPK